MQKRLLLVTALAALLLIGAGCLGGGAATVQAKPITLEYWRTDDDAAALDPIITAYKKLHPYISVHATTMRSEDFEHKLLEALAVDKGPDIFSLPNLSLGAWKSKIMPMPATTTVVTQAVDANKNIVSVKRKTATMSILALRNSYVEGVTKDIVMRTLPASEGAPTQDAIFGLPLSFDTLALYYNKDLLAKASIDKPAVTWRDLQDQATKLTVLDKDGGVVTSGAAIGGAANVRYSADILAAIMAQDGATLSDPDSGAAMFNLFTAETRGKSSTPGLEALLFYQGFENPGALGFSWSEAMPDSLDAFVGGRTAYFFGYPSDAAKIRTNAPRLDFGIEPIPQIDPSRPKNIARYPIEVVSQKTAHPDEAWDFLQFLASQDQVSGWLTSVQRPTALRALITPQLTDPHIAPFVGQILTGNSWYRGKDWSRVEQAFNEMIIYRPAAGHNDYQPLLNQAADIVNSTF